MSDILTIEDYEAGTPGDAISSSNTGWTSAVGTAPVIYGADAYVGAQSARHQASAALSYTAKTFTARSTMSYRCRFKIRGSLPGSATYLFSPLSTSTIRAQHGLNSDGTFRTRNATTLDRTTTGAISADTWYDAAGRFNATTGQQGLRIFLPGDTTPISGMDLSPAASSMPTSTFDRLIAGICVSGSLDVLFDQFQITDADEWIAPAPSPVSATITPGVMALTTVMPALSGQVSSAALLDPMVLGTVMPAPSVAAEQSQTVTPPVIPIATVMPAPTVTAGTGATVTPGRIVLGTVMPAPGIQAGNSATINPAVIALGTVMPAPQVFTGGAAPAPTNPVGPLSSYMFTWFGTRAAGATLADRQYAYFAGVSGLAGTSWSLADHKRNYYRNQLGITLSAAAARSMTELETSFWAMIDATNNVGSWADRARRFYAS